MDEAFGALRENFIVCEYDSVLSSDILTADPTFSPVIILTSSVHSCLQLDEESR